MGTGHRVCSAHTSVHCNQKVGCVLPPAVLIPNVCEDLRRHKKKKIKAVKMNNFLEDE